MLDRMMRAYMRVEMPAVCLAFGGMAFFAATRL